MTPAILSGQASSLPNNSTTQDIRSVQRQPLLDPCFKWSGHGQSGRVPMPPISGKPTLTNDMDMTSTLHGKYFKLVA